MPMQMQQFLKAVKLIKKNCEKINIFLIFAQNIDCGYTFVRGGSKEYLQSMFYRRKRKIMYDPVNPIFTI